MGMVLEMNTLAVISNAHAQAEFEKGREEEFSVLECEYAPVVHDNKLPDSQSTV